MTTENISRRAFISSVLAGLPLLASAQPSPSPAGTIWSNAAAWEALKHQVGGRLIVPIAPWAELKSGPVSSDLMNPWFLEEHAGATQSTGMHGAWTSTVSRYAVAAENVQDIVTTVNFARQHRIRLVIKGTGHDYFGRSCAPDSLLVWTHRLRDVMYHSEFRPHGSPEGEKPVRAVSVSAGNRWLEAYQAATTAGCYIQGGGCTSVGACGGFALGGGFGSYSKKFGSGAGGVLELEVVTADGRVLVANRYQHEDLYWALRGGGGGTFGIVTRMTLLGHDMPSTDGWISGTVSAKSDQAYVELIERYLAFAGRDLCNGNWGEGVLFPQGRNAIEVGTAFLDLSVAQARAVWESFLAPLRARALDFQVDLQFSLKPFKDKWSPRAQPNGVIMDNRPGATPGYFWWKGNDIEVGAYWANYQGRGVPLAAMQGVNAAVLARAVFEASRDSLVLFQTNKGLAGQPEESLARDLTTSMNPAVFSNAGFFTLGSWQQYKYVGVTGHEPDTVLAAREALAVDRAMKVIREATPRGGSYTNEGGYFEENWREEFWGANYSRLLAIKKKFDPTNLFRVHNGVGSELSY